MGRQKQERVERVMTVLRSSHGTAEIVMVMMMMIAGCQNWRGWGLLLEHFVPGRPCLLKPKSRARCWLPSRGAKAEGLLRSSKSGANRGISNLRANVWD